MKILMNRILLAAVLGLSFAGHGFAIGQRAQVFETSSEAGIWDHGSEFYLRMDLAAIADLKDQKFVWAGFQEVSPALFKGEVVCDDKGQERKFPAQAKLLSSTASGRTFFIEVLDERGTVIKEMIVVSRLDPRNAR